MNLFTDNGCSRAMAARRLLPPCCAQCCARLPNQKWFWRLVAQSIGDGMWNLLISSLHRFQCSHSAGRELQVNVSIGSTHGWSQNCTIRALATSRAWWGSSQVMCGGRLSVWLRCACECVIVPVGVVEAGKVSPYGLKALQNWDMMKTKNWRVWSMNLLFCNTRSEP